MPSDAARCLFTAAVVSLAACDGASRGLPPPPEAAAIAAVSAVCPHLVAYVAPGLTDDLAAALAPGVADQYGDTDLPGVITVQTGYGIDIVTLRAESLVAPPWDRTPAGAPDALIFGGLSRDVSGEGARLSPSYPAARALYDALTRATEHADGNGATVRETPGRRVVCQIISDWSADCYITGLQSLSIATGACW